MMGNLRKNTIFAFFLALIPILSFAGGGQHEKEDKFEPGHLILHHVGDAHEWEFAHGAAIPLPVVIYSADRGIEVFSSSNLYHSANREYKGYKLTEDDKIIPVEEGRKIYDISITKNVASLFISVALLLFVFLGIARKYQKNKGKAPSGIQSFFEPIIIYIRDDVARSAIGPKYERFMPYLLTVFFFIWFNNLLGLIPGGANLTGNIAVTLVLALITFLITIFSAKKTYWSHIFNTPGVPAALKPIIIPIEIVGMFSKPFSLMIRLFANITAGHIIILSLFSLIFIFQSYVVGVVSAAFAVFMNLLELFVALLQAYIFTLLSAMYFGAAVEEHHHDQHGHAHEEATY
jgi:F-type H+-transporting ATPase subunit a